MSYQEKVVWTIIPKESYRVIRSCSKCGCKAKYINTGNFRVNANGNCLDIWLIYQCEKCKTTLNLSIYERVNSHKVPIMQYRKFLANDAELAFQYGTNKELFLKNKAEIDKAEIDYRISEDLDCTMKKHNKDTIIVIKNPYSIKIRLEKIIARQFEMSRVQVKKMVECGAISDSRGRDLDKIIIYDGFEISIRI